ncbi:uncharacterized protein LOC134816095 isoform X2 [Bolinopsis microptera]|uniref:uncharacterized protein LOC134816095 isoform X2 n=1 Tax=Bolinopsis microptera TaxID=2820187 RepID=UPI0030799FDD
MSVRGSQSSLRSFTLKPVEPEFLKTNRSAWTPKLDAKDNHKLFLERVSLITHWHDKWNERQRKQLLVHLLQRTTQSEMFSIREWIMKKMPEPQWRADPTSALPKWLMLHIFSYLTTAELCTASKVSSHWRYLSEQDILWRHRTAARGWFLPYSPPPTQHGAWKQYYVMCVKNSEKPSLLVDHQRKEPTAGENQYSRSDLERLGKYYVNTDDPVPEPESPSRIFEKSGHEVEDIDTSLFKDRWVDPNKHPKDLDNWGKATSQEYRPDVRFLQKSKLKARSKSYTQLNASSNSPLKKSDDPKSQLKSKSVSTITEIYREHGSFRILQQEDGTLVKEPHLLTKKGVTVPSINYWLQKPDKPTIPSLGGYGTVQKPELAADVGCGAVWGENLPCHTHPKVLLISSDVPAYEMIVGTVVTGIIGLVYDAEKASLRSILNQVEHSLNGRKAESLGIFAPGKLGYLNLTRHIHISGLELHSEFWKELCGFLLVPKFGGRIDIFSSVGVSTVNQSLGMDIIYRLAGVTSVPFNAPLGGIYGEWAEICGTWLLHPDNVHPLSIYLREDKVRTWVLFAKQLETIAEDIRLQFSHRLHIQHTAGLHRVVNAILRQGLELLSKSEHVHLADILFYSLSQLCTEPSSSPPPNESEQVKRGVLCMRLVDVLLSSQFVKDLEDMKGDEEKEVSDVSEDPVALGKDVMMMLEWMNRSVPLSLQTNSHRLIFPKEDPRNVLMGYNIGDSDCAGNYSSTCPFQVANGSALTIIAGTGFLLSSFTIYCLIFHVKLPLCQNIFVLNVAVSDILNATVGIIRGLGMVASPVFIGVTREGEILQWCHIYPLVGNTVWSASVLVLLPLTLDRFLAIVFPFQYKSLVNKETSRAFSVITWLPLIGLLIYDSVTYSTGHTKIAHQPVFHRCVIENERFYQPIVFLMAPFILIILMYSTMLFFVIKTGLESKRLFVITSAIILTGFITVIPDHLLTTFKIQLDYKIAQVFTVTLYYTNSICNPMIYFCSNRITRRELTASLMQSTVGRKLSDMTSSQGGSGAVTPLQNLGNRHSSDPELNDSKSLLPAVDEEQKV